MQYARFYSFAAALALTIAAAPAGHAQGLGGMLHQAKAKASQAVSSPVAATTSAAQGSLPATPPELTPESNGEYTRALLAYANTLTFKPNSSGDPTPEEVYWYCWLRQKGYPVRFTWDAAALKLTADNRGYLSGYVNDVADDLVKGLTSTYGAMLTPRLAKVKEIHYTTSPQKRSLDEPSTLDGYFLSFNPATGVLTAALSQPDGAISVQADLAVTKWLVKHVKP